MGDVLLQYCYYVFPCYYSQEEWECVTSTILLLFLLLLMFAAIVCYLVWGGMNWGCVIVSFCVTVFTEALYSVQPCTRAHHRNSAVQSLHRPAQESRQWRNYHRLLGWIVLNSILFFSLFCIFLLLDQIVCPKASLPCAVRKALVVFVFAFVDC